VFQYRRSAGVSFSLIRGEHLLDFFSRSKNLQNLQNVNYKEILKLFLGFSQRSCLLCSRILTILKSLVGQKKKKIMTDLFDYDSHLCSKQLNNEPFCKQNNLAAMKSISLESFALSLALASQFRHQVSVMRELGNELLLCWPRFFPACSLNFGPFYPPKKSGNFGLNSNGKVISGNSSWKLWSTFKGTPLFPFGTERRKFSYHLVNFPVSSLSSAENNNKKSDC